MSKRRKNKHNHTYKFYKNFFAKKQNDNDSTTKVGDKKTSGQTDIVKESAKEITKKIKKISRRHLWVLSVVTLIIISTLFFLFNKYNLKLNLNKFTNKENTVDVNKKDERHQESVSYSDEELRQLLETATSTVGVSSTTPQFVLFSFDGSKSIKMWEDTRAFVREMRASSTQFSFTYFINPVYFLTRESRSAYKGPRTAKGESAIGFSESVKDIEDRVNEVNMAFAEGNEIGSHAVGHFNGNTWNKDEWTEEFNSFNSILSNIASNNPGLPTSTKLSFNLNEIIGFRAPELGVSKGLYETLAEKKFLYDASGVGRMSDQPFKDKFGIWHIPLSTIPFGKYNVPVVSMDYSIYAHQSNVLDVAKRGTPEWDKLYDQVITAYRNYFNKNYEDGRAPVVIGHHFSLWNDGVYYEAMKQLAKEVCGKPNVHCTTYRTYAKYLENTQSHEEKSAEN